MNGAADQLKIEVIRGHAAELLLADDAFRAQWSALWINCPWATMFQSPAYVLTWYEVYRQPYEPVLVFTRDADGHLSGLLTLALSSADSRLVAAGEIQAEYQVWISRGDLGDLFPAQAIRHIHRHFPAAVLRLNYLPPGAPTAWLTSAGTAPLHILRAHRRPLVRFGDGGNIAASLAKRTNKNRLRQIEKVGHVEFRHVTDPAEMEAVLDAIIPLHDVRHMTFRGAAPFTEDSRRRTFALALMKIPGLVHVTVLKAGDHVVTAHLGAVKGKEVQLGLIAHNPRFARHSPGKFQILFLSRMLMQQGFEQLDLTAGGDPYKERFADAWDEVQTLALFPTRIRHARGKAIESTKSTTRRGLRLLRLSPNQARLLSDQIRSCRPLSTIAHQIRRAAGWIASHRETRVYCCPAARIEKLDSSSAVRRDAFDHLLLYRPQSSNSPSRRDFVSAAVRRIEEGQHLYTHAENGQLLHCARLVERPMEELTRQILPGYALPSDSALILSMQTFPPERALEIDSMSLRAMFQDAARVAKARNIFMTVPADNHRARALLEKTGFTWQASIFERTRFGRRRSQCVVLDDQQSNSPAPSQKRPRPLADARTHSLLNS